MAEPPGPCGAGRFCYAYAACWADGLLCGVAAPRVLRASRVLSGGPGCLVCRWAAVFLLFACGPDRSPAAARRPPIGRGACVLSGQAPQASRRPPIGRGACVLSGRSRRRPRAPQPGSLTCCLLPRWCSGRRMARPPARLGGLTSFVAAPRSPARPRRPRGGLQSVGVPVCCPARPRQLPWTPQAGPLHPAGLASSGHFPHS